MTKVGEIVIAVDDLIGEQLQADIDALELCEEELEEFWQLVWEDCFGDCESHQGAE